MVTTRRGNHEGGTEPAKILPVGVTIAYKRHAAKNAVGGDKPQSSGTDSQQQQPKSSAVQSRSLLSAPVPKKKKRRSQAERTKRRKVGKVTKPVSSWTIFFEGATLYAACLVLPALVGTLWRLYSDHYYYRHWQETPSFPPNTQQHEATSLYESAHFFYESSVTYLCTPVRQNTDDDNSWSTWMWSQSGSASLASYLCPPPISQESEDDPTARFFLSPDTSTHEDVWTVVCCAVALAILRMLIVQWTVMPWKSADQLQALVRCKSVHLLSSDYSQTPVGTPVLERRTKTIIPSSKQDNLALPDLGLPPTSPASTGYVDVGLNMDESERVVDEPVLLSGEHQAEEINLLGDYHSDDEDDVLPPHASPSTPPNPELSSPTTPPRSLNSAPRYATALFRLLYCTAATGMAFYYFHDSSFWPWYVGGKGSTTNCWDLSGGLTVGMDSDFDHRNAVLKRYFLWQASYHWHSGAFHILSMLLLLWRRPPADDTSTTTTQQWRVWALKTNTFAYIRSLLHHILALGLIATAYVFSSLRRLGAIAMFAFDVSSWFLHLLQVCINAPAVGDDDASSHTSVYHRFMGMLSHPVTIARIHKYLVLPSFCVTRLVIWPALWYSCMFESQQWLQQLERTLWTGSAQQLRWLFHIWLVLVLSTTAVYLHRLIHHAHLKRILLVTKQQQEEEEHEQVPM